jgi:hypothetical protein
MGKVISLTQSIHSEHKKGKTFASNTMLGLDDLPLCPWRGTLWSRSQSTMASRTAQAFLH